MAANEILKLAESALLARQKLPPEFGKDKLKPSYDGLGLANIAALGLHWLSPQALGLSKQPALPSFNPELLGVDTITTAWKNWLQQEQINHVVLLIMDGLGYDQLRTAMEKGIVPSLTTACTSPQAFFMPATSVFPTTTVTALTCAATAYAPAQHGLVCTGIFFQEVGSVVNLIHFQPYVSPSAATYSDAQLNPENLVKVPNIYLRMEKAGVNVEIVNYHYFRNTTISRFTTIGSRVGSENFYGYLTPADAFAQLRSRLLANRDKTKSFTYAYIPNIDTLSHRYGPLSYNYQAELAALDFSLQRELLEPLAGCGDTVLLIVADHGQRQSFPDKVLWLEDHPQLMELMSMTATGERSCRYLFFLRDAESAALNYIEKHFTADFLALSKKEAIELGLFGLPNQTLSLEYSARIGDCILLPKEDWICMGKHGQGLPLEKRDIKGGVHGGLSRAEMLIPFIAYRF